MKCIFGINMERVINENCDKYLDKIYCSWEKKSSSSKNIKSLSEQLADVNEDDVHSI